MKLQTMGKNPLSNSSIAQPFVKWVGGKRSLAAEILELSGINSGFKGFKGYFEPFVGGGAMFFHLRQFGYINHAFSNKRVKLSDVNLPLVATYLAVRDQPDALIEILNEHSLSHYQDLKTAVAKDTSRADRGGQRAERGARSSLYAHYFKTRKDYNKVKQEFTGDTISSNRDARLKLAAMFLYLNRAGFNGMYRENSKGEMNIPPGRYAKPELVNAEVLRDCSAALQGVDLRVRGFEQALKEAKGGDLVYLDPPYYETFTAYSKGGFDYAAQERLAKAAAAAAERGAKVIISNSDTKDMRKLYQDNAFEIGELKAARNINSDGAGRAKVTEIIAFNTLR